MKNTVKILSLLLVLLMLLSSCESGNIEKSTETESSTVSETVSATETETETKTESQTEAPTESKTETETPTETETESETEKPLTGYRAEISRSRSEIESMITLKDSDFEDVQAKLDAFEEIALVSSDFEAVDAIYMEFEDAFYYLDTQISLASIVYDLNRSDEAASKRYLDGYERYGDLYNDYMAVCREVYKTSPIRDKLFEDWTEEDIKMLLSYDPATQELRQENESLLVEYNDLQGDEARQAEIYATIVKNNNQIAKLAGYENYYAYATTEVYGRDYTLDDISAFKGYIQKYMLPALDPLYESWYGSFAKMPAFYQSSLTRFLYNPFDALDKNYLELYVNSFDNSTGEGFKHMFENKNIVFATANNSHESAYQTYLEDFETPFCLFGIDGQSTTTIVHEMGHYYAALHNPHVSSYDLAETQSQGNEFLFLKYASSQLARPVYAVLREYNIYNVVAMSIVCVIIDEFEQRVYSLESVEGYTMADFNKIMTEVCEAYGGIGYVNSNITNMNTYWQMVCPNSPVYYISYATSSIAALSLFAQADKDEAGARETYRKLIEEIEENDGFKGTLNKIGLASPFVEETFKKIEEDLIK